MAWCLRLLLAIGIFVSLSGFAMDPARAAARLALVIGNGKYQNVAVLEQPANDAADVATELRRLGFEVIGGVDLTRDEFLLLVSDFRSKIKSEKAEDVVFYYSGHAFNMFGLNHLVPADARLRSRDQLQLETIRLNDIIAQIQVNDTQKTVFLLDAARASPLPETLQGEDIGSGLAQIETTNATASALMIFATLPNQTTADGNGRHSPFTAALLKHMATPGKNIDAIFPRIRKDVIAATGGKQKPFKQGSPPELFYFNRDGQGQEKLAEAPPEAPPETPPKAPEAPPAAPAAPDDAPAQPDGVLDPVASDEIDVIQGTETADPQQPEPQTPVVAASGAFRDCDNFCPVMVKVSGGRFTMGSSAGEANQKPAHDVTIADFALGQYEVTLGEWRRCVAEEKCRDPGKAQAGNSDDAPVYNLTWDDAVAYADWLSGVTGKSYRLPSEAEWEYAARAGTSFAFSGSNEPLPDFMDCKTCGDVAKHPVPRGRDIKPNAFGLSGMSGGVAEWVADCWVRTYDNHPADGRAVELANCAKRVLRGGSWRDGPKNVTVTSRAYYDRDVPYPNNGFRIARDLP